MPGREVVSRLRCFVLSIVNAIQRANGSLTEREAIDEQSEYVAGK
jgi:hypothetical protein